MIALIPVREGALPLGADEAVAEAGGEAIVAGDGTEVAARHLRTAVRVGLAELGTFAPGAWAAALTAELAAHDVIILPGSADGRDLAPRVSFALERPLLAGATRIGPEGATLVRRGGLVEEIHRSAGPFVATLEPGCRGIEPLTRDAEIRPLSLAPAGAHDAEHLAMMAPDPSTIDLGEAARIIAGGAGLGGPAAFALLREVAAGLGASYGASRVAADLGWVPQDRFIGTTGVTVDPRLYVALGISGAVQHVTGLGTPEHVIAVNLDASAPMMGMADLAIVTDARALLKVLADRLGATDDG